MAGPKTSAEKSREDAENAAADDMFGGAFDGLEGISQPPVSEAPDIEEAVEELHAEEENEQETPEENSESAEEERSEETPLPSEPPSEPPSGPPSGPPSAPPSGPPSGPPRGPPSGPPSAPPSGPPSGPPSAPPSGPPSGPPSAPPSGPPSAPPSAPPSGPPSGPPSEPPSGPPSQITEGAQEETHTKEFKDPTVEASEAEEPQEEVDETVDEASSEGEAPAEDTPTEEPSEAPSTSLPKPNISNRAAAAEKEAVRLSGEVNSLRKSLIGAAAVIEELETEPMPPAVLAADIVVPDHLVADFARLARQLDREQLVRANMGTIAMLHPGMPGVMISTREGTILARMNERGLVGARLGQGAPEGSPTDWRVLEVLLASKSLETGGPAACIHMMGAYTTAASCEKDLILCSPIDEVGKKELGKIVIVDPDDANPDDALRQTAEALKQGGMKCVVVRGHGAYCVGADLDDAWANAAMLEHSMRIVLIARQANLKV